MNLSKSSSPFIDIVTDLSSEKSVEQAIQVIKQEHSAFRALILNAGIMPLARVGEITFCVDTLFRVNILSSIQLVNALFGEIRDTADVVFVSSTAGLKGASEHPVYCSSKHAIQGFTRSLRIELADSSSRVITFSPGGFNSNLRGGVVKEGYMSAKELAKVLVSSLLLPSSMEVSDIVVNRN